MKGKFHKTFVWPAVIYGSEYWALNEKEEIKLKIADTSAPRKLCDMTRLDKSRKNFIGGVTDVVEKTGDGLGTC